MANVVVTGSNGLIGSEAVLHYDREGHSVFGFDNNMRRQFFGPQGDTTWNLKRLREGTRRYQHFDLDIRDRDGVLRFFRTQPVDVVIHCAAQPSHDKAREIAFDDFDVNATGTLNLLEATRLYSPEATFLFMSTNKVYGDAVNELPFVELETRYDYARPEDYDGIREDCRVDQSLHSLFGASKAAADLLAQEYGRYFNMKIGIFRGGCLTGAAHSGVELHGFLSYLIKAAVTGIPYTVYGYKAKQVRDQLHSSDVIGVFDEFIRHPRCGEVYNLGGGRENSASVLECITLINEISGHQVEWTYEEKNRVGDHICYISNLQKLREHFPDWKIQRALPDIIEEIIQSKVTAVTQGH